MHYPSEAKAAYGSALHVTRDPKALEFALFGQITSRLKAAANAGTPISTLAGALAENRKLWSRIAVLVADDANVLPDQLRAQLFYLHEFVEDHSRKVLAGSAGLAPLVEINRSVMQGLSGQEKAA